MRLTDLIGKIKKIVSHGKQNQTSPKNNKTNTITFRAPFKQVEISLQALSVLKTLKKSGYMGFVVGGSVRDLLLEGTPKDFDVATNAKPEEIRKIFSNCRLIGRRFRIAHILFRNEIVEVTTFRSAPNEKETNNTSRFIRSNEHGLLIADNQYGTIEEDADRRDFTVNAFYYDADQHVITDFSSGMKDLQNKQLVMIGNPGVRFREDPVRMLRAARLAAKLSFTIDPDIEACIPETKTLLYNVSPARLFDETIKLFLMGHAEKTFDILCRLGIFSLLYPATANSLNSDAYQPTLIRLGLINTDQRIINDKRVTPAFLYACLLWHPMQTKLDVYIKNGEALFPALNSAMMQTLANQSKITLIPKALMLYIRDIWELQTRLAIRTVKSVRTVIEFARFRAGYDFLLLREKAGENVGDLANWWASYQDAGEQAREIMLKALKSSGTKKKKRKRSPKKSPPNPQETQPQ